MKRITYRKCKPSDLPFLHEMLYEAVYWMKKESYPSFSEAMSDTEFAKEFLDFGRKTGDIAVIAESDSTLLGAAWIRCWNKEDNIRGYISDDIPILAIAVLKDYRHAGIGKKLINTLKAFAKEQSINKLSLCVTKTNYALNLYKKCGFEIYEDIGDSYNMLVEMK